MTTLQSMTRSQFFLDYNFNYTNVSNFLIWHKTNFATLTTDEIKTLKAKMLKLPKMLMDIFRKVLGNIDEKIPIFDVTKINTSSTGTYCFVYHSHREFFLFGIKEKLPSLPLQWGTCLS